MIEKLLARLEAFLNGNFVPKADLDAAMVKLAELSERATGLESALATETAAKDEMAKSLNKSIAAAEIATTENGLLKADIDSLKAQLTTVDAAASKKAAELCAAQGIKADKLPEASTEPATSVEAQLDKLRAEMSTETNPIKRAELAAKCRDLRGHADLFNDKKS